MAIYHFHVTQISRGKGQTAVSATAYRAGEKLHDGYYGEEPDYTKKGGVLIELVRKFISENFTARGMISDMAIHMQGKSPGDIPNPHVHVLVPMRPLNEDGTWGS